MCEGKTGEAKHYLLLGANRQTLTPGQIVDGRDPNPADVLNSSDGQTLELPVYHYPATMAEGAGLDWGPAKQAPLDKQNSLHTELAADRAQLTSEEKHWTALTQARTEQVLTDINDASDLVPTVVALDNKAIQTQLAIDQLQLKGVGELGCLNPNLHGQWLSEVQAYDTQERDAGPRPTSTRQGSRLTCGSRLAPTRCRDRRATGLGSGLSNSQLRRHADRLRQESATRDRKGARPRLRLAMRAPRRAARA